MTALDRAIFLDHIPYFHVPDMEFQLIVAEFLKCGIIYVARGEIVLTKAGKQHLHTKRIPFDKELGEIHTQVMTIYNNTPQRSHEEISKYIKLLSEFNSNPESINYIGKTLLSLRIFLSNQTEWDKEKVKIAQKEIEEILNEVSESERVEMGTFDPIFNLSKIMRLIDFLNVKLQEVKHCRNSPEGCYTLRALFVCTASC